MFTVTAAVRDSVRIRRFPGSVQRHRGFQLRARSSFTLCVGFPTCEIQEMELTCETFRTYVFIVCTLLVFGCCYCRNLTKGASLVSYLPTSMNGFKNYVGKAMCGDTTFSPNTTTTKVIGMGESDKFRPI